MNDLLRFFCKKKQQKPFFFKKFNNTENDETFEKTSKLRKNKCFDIFGVRKIVYQRIVDY